MKRKVLTAVLSVILLSGCAGSTEADTVTEASPVTEAISVTETSTAETAETVKTVDISDYKGALYEWEFADELVVKNKNAFSEETMSAALDAVKSSDVYKRTSEKFANAEKTDEGGYEFDVGGTRDYTPLEVAEYFDENGNILPKFNSGVTADFDGDGSEETFLLFTLPEPYLHGCYFEELVFINSGGKASVPEDGEWGADAVLKPIRYNGFIHMGYDSGINIGTSHGEIYVVENGEAVNKVCMFHLGSPYKKAFMKIGCAQAFGCGVLFWNDELNAYCEIDVEELTDEQAQVLFDSEAFQSDSELTEKFTFPEQIKDAFYCSGVHSFHTYDDRFIVFLYENGVFTQTDFDDMISPLSFEKAVPVTGLNMEKALDNIVYLE